MYKHAIHKKIKENSEKQITYFYKGSNSILVI